MKGRLLGLAAATALVLGFASSGAYAQSAKFSASWSDQPVVVDTTLQVDAGSEGPVVKAEVVLATIHTSKSKELLIGVSAEIALFTLTQAKGKAGDGTTAVAEGSVNVSLALEDVDGVKPDHPIVPGPITFASRLQELTVTADNGDDTAEAIVRLLLDTTAAHHFNFLAIDVPQGTWDIVATFDLSAFAEVSGVLAKGEARAKVFLNDRVIAVQAVRAVKDGIIKDPLD